MTKSKDKQDTTDGKSSAHEMLVAIQRKAAVLAKSPMQPSREAEGKGRVIQHTHANKQAEHGFPPLDDLAATMRVHLKRAGVERADLHEARSTTKRVTFYDLRATGITWEVLAGTDHVKIMQRAGHLNFSTTQNYIREAEAVGIAAGEPFAAFPESLLQAPSSDPDDDPDRQTQSVLSQDLSRDSVAPPSDLNHSTNMASPTGFEPVLQP